MREISHNWQVGFEESVRGIKVTKEGPFLPSASILAQRFPCLSSLDVGESLMAVASLTDLASLQKLRSLSLRPYHIPLEDAVQWDALPLGCRVAEDGLQALRGSPLTKLVLSDCQSVKDNCLQHLGGIQHLASLDLGDSPFIRITDDGIKFLRGLPLTELSLYWLTKITGDSLWHIREMPLTCLNLERSCDQLQNSDLQHLVGLPLTDLSLGPVDCGQSLLHAPCDLRQPI